MHKRLMLIGFRILLGVVTLVAIITQGVHLHAHHVLNIFNYLGYFTNLSNIFAACVFIISGAYVALNRHASRTDTIIRGAATLYMTITGLIYVTLLTGEDLGLLMPWVNIVTHIIMPIAVFGDWIIHAPRIKLGLKYVALWLIFPVLYLGYSLVRGSITNWYPYPFLNPDKVGGYGGVTLYCIGISVLFCAVGWFILRVHKNRQR